MILTVALLARFEYSYYRTVLVQTTVVYFDILSGDGYIVESVDNRRWLLA